MKSLTDILFVIKHARDTAGLIWQPEILPINKDMITITSPNVREVTNKEPPVTAATPQAKNTNTNVPMASAM